MVMVMIWNEQVEADRMALLSIERNIANMERRWLNHLLDYQDCPPRYYSISMLCITSWRVLCMPASIIGKNDATMTIKQKLQWKLYLPPKINLFALSFGSFLHVFGAGGVGFFLHFFWHVVIRIFITIWHHFRHLRHNPPKSRKFEEVSLSTA